GRAVEGAMRRLGDTGCQRVLREFSNPDGAPLQEILDRRQLSADEFVSGLTFVDGSLTPQCQTRHDIAAFTAPGLRLIYICGDRFVQNYSSQPKAAEMLVIHETLHALGLGENPPSSAEITARVTGRCTGRAQPAVPGMRFQPACGASGSGTTTPPRRMSTRETHST